VTIYCATTNPGKLKEFGLIVAHYSQGRVAVEPVPGLKSVAAPEESETTFSGNAAIKANFYSSLTTGLVFADDSGLACDALNGAPGVYSARYAGEHATDAANNAKLLAEIAPHANRTARFVCAIAVAEQGKTIATFEDFVEGRIVDEPKGTFGFGYDPLFFYPPFGTTFGEAPPEKKLFVSHRGKAMAAMIASLRQR
jgi:XTP/dITP diphosphohydrolase